VVHIARTTLLLSAISLGLCGCGSSSETGKSSARALTNTVDLHEIDAPTRTEPTALRAYLRAWEASWARWVRDLQRDGDDDVALSATPDASWNRAQRVYGDAALAYRQEERRLTAIRTPLTMRVASEAYIDAVRRQATRLQAVSDAYGGTDADALYRAEQALQLSQMQFDQDGAQWERAVIAACKASSVDVPKIVRLEHLSNGQRTG
jgi:hypothetical protein